ncbi:unnamed protein product [Acanthoscelides obtectus]|uniref:Alkyl transferase n=1 Tax=Acanthoscelides obtectus TaxID=200917 RepID=A0A9P0L4Z7_ACAOB|nr:unnamed protein product [Acanthoscelides obtectus]CAK1674986.1 Dehydrodolichyl diphosphate synthase complex subunit Dhdds [Acanthoscelides obtectus]
MDGNRRYAIRNKMGKTEGHTKGFERLAECLLWCRELGVKEVTVYAFSIENFNRTIEEVINLVLILSFRVFEEKDKIMMEGIKIRVIGNLSLVPEDIRILLAKSVLLTKDNDKSILNIAFSYTARDEIVHSMKTVVEGLESKKIKPADVDADLISYCMYSNQSPDPDILIRTSGEVRLSDFLLWQISQHTQICFTSVLWPDFSIWHLLGCIFKYQRAFPGLKKYADECQSNRKKLNDRITSFLGDIEKKRMEQMEIYAKT